MSQRFHRFAPPALALAVGLVGGALVGEVWPAEPDSAPASAAAPTQSAPMLGPLDDADPTFSGPDPFYEPPDETGLCSIEQAEVEASEELAELRAAVMRESGLLAGRLGKRRTGPRALRERFPAFPGAQTPISDIGQQLAANGVPMNLAFFETRASAPQVLEYYAQHFSSQGWSWTGIEENYKVIPHPAVSATDPEERVQMTVMVLEAEGEQGGSTVVLGLADMAALAEDPAADVGDLPIFPGAEPLAMRSLDAEVHSLTVSYIARESLETLSSFYSEQMRERGYSEQEIEPAHVDETGTAIRSMRFASSQGRWAIALTSVSGETGVTAVHTSSEASP